MYVWSNKQDTMKSNETSAFELKWNYMIACQNEHFNEKITK